MTARLIIDITGSWTVTDMSSELAALDHLYVFVHHKQSLQQESESLFPRRFLQPTLPPLPLIVRRIEYASPGIQDLAGVGKILEVISDLIKYFAERKRRNLGKDIENSEKLLDLERKALELRRAEYEFNRDHKLSSMEMEQRMLIHEHHMRVLEDCVTRGMITDARTIPLNEGHSAGPSEQTSHPKSQTQRKSARD